MTTGEKIKAARKKSGLTQKELGRRIGVAYQTLAQWENDLRKPKYATLQRIAAALNVEWTELVPEEDQGQTVIDHMKEKLSGRESSEKISTDELIDLLKERIKEDPDTIKKLNDAFSNLAQINDDSLVKISETDGIPKEFLLSNYGKKKVEEVQNLLATIDKDGFLELLEYLRYISYRQEKTQPPKDTPTTSSKGTADTTPLESPLEGTGEGTENK